MLLPIKELAKQSDVLRHVVLNNSPGLIFSIGSRCKPHLSLSFSFANLCLQFLGCRQPSWSWGKICAERTHFCWKSNDTHLFTYVKRIPWRDQSNHPSMLSCIHFLHFPCLSKFCQPSLFSYTSISQSACIPSNELEKLLVPIAVLPSGSPQPRRGLATEVATTAVGLFWWLWWLYCSSAWLYATAIAATRSCLGIGSIDELTSSQVRGSSTHCKELHFSLRNTWRAAPLYRHPFQSAGSWTQSWVKLHLYSGSIGTFGL